MKTQLTIDNLPKVNIETIETAKSRNIQKENNINDYSTNITSSHRGRIKLKKSLSLANFLFVNLIEELFLLKLHAR